MCLPLKLSGFERYMWQDGRETHPMVFYIRLGCTGEVDAAAFREAVRLAIERHPLLRARVAGQRFRAASWVASPEPMPYLDIDAESAPLTFPFGEAIDLTAENGLRIWVRQGEGRTTLCLQFHHACCDGYGANQFFEDVLCAYDWILKKGSGPCSRPTSAPEGCVSEPKNGPDPGTPAWAPLDPARLAKRTRYGLNWWRQLVRLFVDTWGMVLGLFWFFLPKPAAAVSPEAPTFDDTDAKAVPRLLAYRFTGGELKKLLGAAKAARVTLNDLILRDVMWGLYQWNVAHDPSLRKWMTRIMVPADLRAKEDVVIPAANIVGMFNIDRHLHWKMYRDPAKLLRTIKLEMRYMRFARFAITFARITQMIHVFGHVIPWLNRLMYGVERCLVTTVLSNSGRVFTQSPLTRPDGKLGAGGLVIDTIEGAPPQRIYTGLAFSVFTYAGEFSVVMNYDRRRFTRRGAAELLDHLVRQIATSGDIEVRPLSTAEAENPAPRQKVETAAQ